MIERVLVFVAAIVCGFMLGTINPPYYIPYIGIFGLPLAFWISKKLNHPKLVGYGLGFGYFFLTMSWITEPFQVEQDLFGWMAYPAWVIMAAGLAVFWLPIFLGQKRGVVFVAITFGAVELLRGWIFTGFPWALLNYGFIDTPFAASASIIGSFGLSVALLFVVLALFGPTQLGSRVLGGIILIALLLPSFLRGEPSITENANFKVSLVQANVTQAESFDYSRAQEFIDLQLEMSQGNADLVVWPEGSTRISPSYDLSLIPSMVDKLNGQALIFGAINFDENDRFYNAAYLIDKSGKEIYRYEKRHLVPFGEYIPFGNWFAKMGIATQTMTRFSMSKGVNSPWPETHLPKMNILICYEGIFPKYARMDGAFIVLITNDSWFGNAGGPTQHLVAARYRAIESGKPLARSAKTGISAIVDAKGAIVSSVPLNEKGVVTAEIGPRYESTIYNKIGNWPLYILIVTAFLTTVRDRKKRRQLQRNDV